jgi:hypothetical protein
MSMTKEAKETKLLGDYLLQDMLGKGAYGTVYRGHHSDVRKGRNMVAIKVIQIDLAVKKGSNIKVRRTERAPATTR